MLRDIAETHLAAGDRVSICTAWADDAERAAREAWARDAGVDLHHMALVPDRGRHPLGRLGAMARFSAFALRTAMKLGPEAITVTSYPILTPAFPLTLWARAKGVRQLYHVQDIFVQNLRSSGGWRGRVARLLAPVERAILRGSDAVVTLSGDMKASLGGGARILVRQNYTPNSAALGAAQGGDPVLVYAGNMGVLQNLPHFLRAAAIARTQVPFRVLMLGGGSMLGRLRDMVRDEKMEFVDFQGVVPRDEAARIVAGCDIGVVSAKAGLFSYAYPSKVFTYWASGLPVLVLAEPGGAVAAELAAEGLGRAGDPADPAKLAQTIVAMVEDVQASPPDRAALAARVDARYGRAAFLDDYRDRIRPAWLGDAA